MNTRRFWLTIGLLAAAFAGGGVSHYVFATDAASTQGTDDTAETITAERFELIDADGNVRATLGVKGDDVALLLYDDGGQMRTFLGTDSHEPLLAMYDREGERRLFLAVLTAVANLTMSGTNGAEINLGVVVDCPYLGMAASKTGSIDLSFYLSEPYNPFLAISDDKGNVRAHLGLSDENNAALHILDAEQKTIWSAP